ncbi:MAG: hypothetical protein V2A74_12360, partial [bacterium]
LPRLVVQVAPLTAILTGLGLVEGAKIIRGRELPEPIRFLMKGPEKSREARTKGKKRRRK